jgi:endonuclease G
LIPMRLPSGMAKSTRKTSAVLVILAIVIVVLQQLGVLPEGLFDGGVTTGPAGPSVPTGPTGLGEDHLFAGAPRAASDLTVLEYSAFTIGYDEQRANPAWVAYSVSGAPRYENGDRPSRFHSEERTQSKISHDDYTRSGYDRGHMAPNYAIATRYGRDAQLETFSMANIIPQSPELNRGPWKSLEERISSDKGMAERLGTVWVITGPVFYSRSKTLPGTSIAIPDATYKIVLDEDDSGTPRALAFLMHQEPRGEELEDYLVSIDAIEKETGLDFFSSLPDATEDALEQQVAQKLW